jgi:hypothetical protein
MRHRSASVVVNSTDAEDIPRVMGASTAVFASIINLGNTRGKVNTNATSLESVE